MPENKITRQSIREAIDEKMVYFQQYLAYPEIKAMREYSGIQQMTNERKEELKSIVDSKIQELLGQIIAKERPIECYDEENCTCAKGQYFNEAIAEIKEKISAARYEIK